jgi:hypothetical protein
MKKCMYSETIKKPMYAWAKSVVPWVLICHSNPCVKSFLNLFCYLGICKWNFFWNPELSNPNIWKAKIHKTFDNPFLSSWLDLYNKSDDVCLSDDFTATYKPILLPSLDCIQTHSSLPTWTWQNIWTLWTQMYPISLPCNKDNNIYSYQKKMQLNIPAY